MSNPLSREQALDRLALEHAIEGPDIYLLELIPLIEVIWADGVAQAAEIDIMHEFVLGHVAGLTAAAGMEIVSEADVTRFFQRFISKRPSAIVLKDIRELSAAVMFGNSDSASNQEKSDTILAYCLDISAAAVLNYPYGRRDRIVQEEKKMLLEIMTHFHIALDRKL